VSQGVIQTVVYKGVGICRCPTLTMD